VLFRFKRLLRQLKNTDTVVRKRAAGGLGDLGDARAIPHLITALADQDPGVRYFVVGALSSLSGEAAGTGLINALQDSEFRV